MVRVIFNQSVQIQRKMTKRERESKGAEEDEVDKDEEVERDTLKEQPSRRQESCWTSNEERGHTLDILL